MASVWLLAGLGFGDEGKGTTIDWLARQRPTTLVVRYNGGAQAAHNVVVTDGPGATVRHHTFAQLGSATFHGVPTLLSRFVLVNPVALASEARHLASIGVASPLSMLRVEQGALVTTPLHVAMNRLREMARTGRHGSCGMGIGETREDAILHPEGALHVRDLPSPRTTRDKLLAFRERKLGDARALAGARPSEARRRELEMFEAESTIERSLEHYAAFVRDVQLVDGTFLAEILRAPGQVLFEGAQGVLLDQDFGFQPHTTWTDITFANAARLLDEAAFDGPRTRLGVVRAYATRHGAGPFVTEDRAWDPASSHDHNRTGDWQGAFRSGAFDIVATRYALDVIGGVDGLVMTNLDRLETVGALSGAAFAVPVCTAYAGSADPDLFVGEDDRITGIRVRRPFDLEHQERLAAALFERRPIHERIDRRTYAATLAERLGVPLALLSFGRTAAAKRAPSRASREALVDPASASGRSRPGGDGQNRRHAVCTSG